MVVEARLLPLVRAWVRAHSAGFLVSYPLRQVNSLYLDTLNLQDFVDNLEGLSDRKKVRIRWYGNQISGVSAALEIKRKHDQSSSKTRYMIAHQVDLNSGIRWRDFIAKVHSELPVQAKREMMHGPTPVLLNHYFREYYTTLDSEVRLTLDFAQEVYDQRLSVYPNLRRRAPLPNMIVLEVKGENRSWKRIKDIVHQLPVPVSKSSKYAAGCGAISNH